MNLSGTQLKDTYGNLLTIGTTAGSPQTGTLQNGAGEDITSLELNSNSLSLNGTSPTIYLMESDATDLNTRISSLNSQLQFRTINDAKSVNTIRLTLDHSSGDISFRDGSANEAFYWDASTARLGIGTTSPTSALTVHDDGSANSTTLVLANSYDVADVAGDSSALMFQLKRSYASGVNDAGFIKSVKEEAWDATSDRNSALTFGTRAGASEPTERLRIDSSGNVGIGTDTILGSANRLHVKVDDSNTDFSLGTPWHLLIENDNTGTNTGAMLGLRANNADGGIALHYNGAQNSGYMTFHVDAGGGVNGERLRIDSSGNVGIGETDPDSKLHLKSASAELLELERTSVGAYRLSISVDDRFSIYDVGASSERISIKSDGNVGIGVTPSTDAKVEISGGGVDIEDTVTPRLRFYNSTTFQSGIEACQTVGAMIANSAIGDFAIRSQSNMLFATGGNTERMRIDSSGNLLVGTTQHRPANNNVNGVSIDSTYGIEASVTSGGALTANRKSTDGGIIEFQKDGTTVGSIGTEGGDMTIGNGDTGVQFGDAGDYIRPWNISTNAARDNAVDLGVSTTRFKDLYLGGSVYLGGTASANALDDYEEGTWDPEFGDGTTFVAVSDTYNYYTKIGRQVTANARIVNADKSSFSSGDSIYITLPFVSDGDYYGTIYLRGPQAGVDTLQTIQVNNNSDNFVILNLTMADVIDDSTDYWFTVTYFV